MNRRGGPRRNPKPRGRRRSPSIFLVLVVALFFALSGSLVVLNMTFQTIFSDLLDDSMDTMLRDRMQNLKESMVSFERLMNLGKNYIEPEKLRKILKGLEFDPKKEDSFSGNLVQLHDQDGHEIMGNSDAKVVGLREIKIGKPQTVMVQYADGAQVPMRVLRDQVPNKNSVPVTLTVGRRMDLVLATRAKLADAMARGLVPVAVVIMVIMIVVFRSLLNPLYRLLDGMKSIKADNLGQHVELRSRIREVNELASQFNQMLKGLDRSFAAQKNFSAQVSHQFRTPLAVMSGQIQTELANPGIPDSARQVMEDCLEEIGHLDNLLGVLLNLTRAEAGGVGTPVPVDLSALARGLAEDFELVARSRDCTVVCGFQALPEVKGNPALLRQALLNLMDNASKYAHLPGSSGTAQVQFLTGYSHTGPRKAEVWAKDWIWFRTVNHGPVIPPEELDRLGERFFRGRTEVKDGIGLGLSLSMLVTRLHQGCLEIESSPMEGTRFTLFLPVM